MMARMMRKERSASHRVSSTPASIAPTIRPARSVRVANSSSDSGTGPVRRIRTPCSGVRSSVRRRLADRGAGRRPRLQRIEVQPGFDLDEAADLLRLGRRAGEQRPPGQVSRCCPSRPPEHVGETRHRGVDIGKLRLAWPTPSSTVSRLVMMPRSDGSAASEPRKGCALINWPVVACDFLAATGTAGRCG